MAKNNKKKEAAGRPTKYRPELDAEAERLCGEGAIDTELAKTFEVDVTTIYEWKKTHPTFSQAIKRGKAIADDMVEQSLFKRALGYSHDAVKIMQYEGCPIEVEYIERYAPDPVACIFWLKNRRPEQWRDRQEIKHDIPPIPVLNIGTKPTNE